jgi:hypothetical protein
MARSEFLDLNHTSNSLILVSLDSEVRSRAQPRTRANFGIGTLAATRHVARGRASAAAAEPSRDTAVVLLPRIGG